MRRFYINQDDICSLGLRGSALLCYTALRALCANSSNWEGSYQRLADESGCGSRMTAERSVLELVNRGLIKKDDNQFSIVHFEPSSAQNVQSDAQNVPSDAQNVQFAKEKSSKKENVIKEIKNKKACEYSVTEHARDDVMEIININEPPKYTYPDYYRVAIECGYLNPKPLADSFRDYYNDHGWPAGRDKLRMFRTWLNNEQRFETGRKPTLTEDERLILLTFVDKLPKRLMQHFSEQLRRLELTPDKIIFFVDKERHDKFRQWMIDINAVEILAAYNRKVYVRPA